MGNVEYMTPREQFAAWLANAMRNAGLDIDKQMGGGRAAFAKAVGVAPSTINRWLAGQTMPDPEKFEAIATTLDRDGRPPADATVDMLVEIGIISPQLANEQRNPAVRSSPMTPTELADEAGIRDPVERQLFAVFLKGLTRSPYTPTGQGEDGSTEADAQRG